MFTTCFLQARAWQWTWDGLGSTLSAPSSLTGWGFCKTSGCTTFTSGSPSILERTTTQQPGRLTSMSAFYSPPPFSPCFTWDHSITEFCFPLCQELPTFFRTAKSFHLSTSLLRPWQGMCICLYSSLREIISSKGALVVIMPLDLPGWNGWKWMKMDVTDIWLIYNWYMTEADGDAVTPSSIARSYTLWSVPSSDLGRSFLILIKQLTGLSWPRECFFPWHFFYLLSPSLPPSPFSSLRLRNKEPTMFLLLLFLSFGVL